MDARRRRAGRHLVTRTAPGLVALAGRHNRGANRSDRHARGSPPRRVSRWPWLYRTAERIYTAAVVAVTGSWLTAAAAIGPTQPPLPPLAIAGTLACAVPWWAHHRRRAKVRVVRTLDAWPDIGEAVGLAGSRVLSAVVDRWGFTARLGLPRGQTVRQVIDAIPAIESGLGSKPGAVRVEPDQSRADRAILRVVSPIRTPRRSLTPTSAEQPTASRGPCRSACSRTVRPQKWSHCAATSSSAASWTPASQGS